MTLAEQIILDRAAYLNAGEFAISVIANGMAIPVIFSEPETIIDDMGGLIVTRPMGIASTSDLQAAWAEGGVDGSILEIQGKLYQIVKSVDNGDGFSSMEFEVVE